MSGPSAEANKEGFDEVVMLNERGEVTECTSANIFAVKDGKDSHAAAQFRVSRRLLPEASSWKLRPKTGISVVGRPAGRDLYSAEEFSSPRQTAPHQRERNRPAARSCGPVCDRMNDLFSAYVDDYVSRPPRRRCKIKIMTA